MTCKFKGTDEPSVTWTVAGSVVSDSDDGIAIEAGSLSSSTNERSVISSLEFYKYVNNFCDYNSVVRLSERLK